MLICFWLRQRPSYERAPLNNTPPFCMLAPLVLLRDSRGHIVTCYHTVKGLAEVKVRAGRIQIQIHVCTIHGPLEATTPSRS